MVMISISLVSVLFLYQNCGEFAANQVFPTTRTNSSIQDRAPDSVPTQDLAPIAVRSDDQPKDPILAKRPVQPLLLNNEFIVGVNYAWTKTGFGSDFGGVGNNKGISQRRASVESDFKKMKDNGITVVRWWMFPKFFGDGVKIDQAGNVSGFGGTLLADLEAAIDIAQKYEIKLMLCFFSFDNFTTEEGYPLLSTVLKDKNKLNTMVNNIIAPIVSKSYEYISTKRYDNVIHSWDIINEPEWAIERLNPSNKDITDFEPCKKNKYINAADGKEFDYCYGDEDEKNTDTVSLDQMETLVQVASSRIKSIKSDALVNVGFASAKWAHLWTDKLRKSVDFYQVHIYEWVHKYVFPYDKPLNEFQGLEGKPVIMGEYPVYIRDDQVGRIGHLTLINKWYDLGYSGIMAWHFNNIDDILPESYGLEKFLNDISTFSAEKGL